MNLWYAFVWVEQASILIGRRNAPFFSVVSAAPVILGGRNSGSNAERSGCQRTGTTPRFFHLVHAQQQVTDASRHAERRQTPRRVPAHIGGAEQPPAVCICMFACCRQLPPPWRCDNACRRRDIILAWNAIFEHSKHQDSGIKQRLCVRVRTRFRRCLLFPDITAPRSIKPVGGV